MKIHARSSVQETRADCPSPILACFKYGMQVRRATFQWECGAGIPLPAGPCHCGLAARILSLFFFSFLVTHLIPSSFPSSASTASASHSWVGCIVVGQSAGCVPSQRRGPAKQRPEGPSGDQASRPQSQPKEAIEQNPRAVIGERCRRDAVTANALARRGKGGCQPWAVATAGREPHTSTRRQCGWELGSLSRSCWVVGASLLGALGGLEWPRSSAKRQF